MRKRITILCMLVLVISLSACGSKEKDYSNQTVMGKVISIDGNSITIQIAKMNMPEETQSGPGNMPQGQMPPTGESGTPPEMPNGDSATSPQGQAPPTGESGTPPTGENGTSPQGQTPPADENGSMPEMPSGGNMPQSGSGSGSEQPAGNSQMPDMFEESDEKITIRLEGVTIKVASGTETTEGSKDDIKADSIITVEFGDNNTVKTITVNMQGDIGMPRGN